MQRTLGTLRLPALVALFAVLLMPAIVAASQNPDSPAVQVDLCHAVPSEAQPYKLFTVTVGSTDYDAHLAHTETPVDLGSNSWPDIIPAPKDAEGNSTCPATPPPPPVDPATGSITIHKVDQNGKPLAGACFNLGAVLDFMAAQSGACTDETGTLVVDGLAVPGTYQLAEETPPDGCTTGGDLPAVTLSAEHSSADVTVTNTCATPDVTPPATATMQPTETAAATVPPTTVATVPPVTTTIVTGTAATTATATASTAKTTVSTLPTTGSGPSASAGAGGISLLLGAASLLLVGVWTTVRRQRR